MSKKLISLAAASIFIFSAQSWAGMPIKDQVNCPIGIDIIEITQTASCSTMARMLSLKPVTSCDFVTKIPVCPSNKLPMYREFSGDELSSLPELIATTEFKSLADVSRFYGAFHLERNLKPDDAESQFMLLQRGIWQDQSLLNNKKYVKDYHAAFKSFARHSENKNIAFWYGAAGYTALRTGEKKAARSYLEDMAKLADPDNEYLSKYIKALDYCVKHMDNAKLCGPFSTIRSHDKL